jgi:E3 ubiquitin-protein ligase SHPRH
LSQQWIDELARHAPSLKVLVYPGWQGLSLWEKTEKKRALKQKQAKEGNVKAVDVTDTEDPDVSLVDKWSAYINTFDVCVTTYDTLRRDLYVARATPQRLARETAEYSRDRRVISLLVACEWYRVIMDEVRSFHSTHEMRSRLTLIRRFKWLGEGKRRACSGLLSAWCSSFMLSTSGRWCLSFRVFRPLLSPVHLLKLESLTYPMFSS